MKKSCRHIGISCTCCVACACNSSTVCMHGDGTSHGGPTSGHVGTQAILRQFCPGHTCTYACSNPFQKAPIHAPATLSPRQHSLCRLVFRCRLWCCVSSRHIPILSILACPALTSSRRGPKPIHMLSTSLSHRWLQACFACWLLCLGAHASPRVLGQNRGHMQAAYRFAFG